MAEQKRNELRHERLMDEVSENLWMGDAEAATDEQVPLLKSLNITHVVSIGIQEDHWAFRTSPTHILLPIADQPFVFITDYFKQVFQFIGDAINLGTGVLIHCSDGKRSAAIAIAYLMKVNQKPYSDIVNKVIGRRRSKRCMPNIGFQIQLRAFGKRRWDTSVMYSDEIDLEMELATGLKNLARQVNQLEDEIREAEQIQITFAKINPYKSGLMTRSTTKERKALQKRRAQMSPHEIEMDEEKELIRKENEINEAIENAKGLLDDEWHLCDCDCDHIYCHECDAEWAKGLAEEQIGVKRDARNHINLKQKQQGGGKKCNICGCLWVRRVFVGLDSADLSIFKREWLLLVFLAHQYMETHIAIHGNILDVLKDLGDEYFDLVDRFDNVFVEGKGAKILNYQDPIQSIKAAVHFHEKKVDAMFHVQKK